MLEIRLLGPFELTVDGKAAVRLSAPKIRQVLTLLALNANRVVSTDQFLCELWADRPPRSARTTLQTYIYQLRKNISRLTQLDRTPVTLETTDAGYLLRVPTAAVDVHRFCDLAAEGRARIAEGDSLLGVETLDRALALWSKTSMTENELGSVLQAEAVRLEELRRTVLEERIEAKLGLGLHHQVVGELLGLVAAHPTHEGLRAKLMLALHRSGRRSEALTAYRDARSVLAAELGLEPCPELRQLHSRILDGDPSLDLHEDAVPGRPGPPPRRLVPSELPPDVRLVGRRRQVEALSRALTEGPGVGRPVVVVTGAPASGKSALCARTAHQVRADYPDGQLWAELTTPDGRPVPPGEILGDFLLAAGFPPARIPEDVDLRVRMFRSWAADLRLLVVLDDVVDVTQLLPLLPGGSRSATLLTCRRRLSDPLITAVVPAPTLSRAAAWQLLSHALGPDRLAYEAEAALRVIRVCQGLPGALHAVARHLEMRPHWSLARVLEGTEPDAFDVLAPSLRRTYRLLTPAGRSAFRTLAVAGSVVTAEEAATALGVPVREAEALLDELVEVQLAHVSRESGGGAVGYRFTWQGLSKTWVDLACGPDDRDTAEPTAWTGTRRYGTLHWRPARSAPQPDPTTLVQARGTDVA
ncbi:BTAD domain-containing putative transcriptional regulator [Streptomyces sp. NPDC087212]|uniref:AfsR/SARP family transcriptional regulator n=1 Tax=Streptomyces sp. NPDC087212 TaxID=3365766 RepID=UPI00381E3221